MKRFILASALGLALVPMVGGPAFANSTDLTGPGGPGGRPSTLASVNGRVDTINQIAISDASLGVNYPSVVSGVSSPISVTWSASLAVTNYPGNYAVRITNTDATVVLIAFASMTGTAISSTQNAGVTIPAYGSAVVRVHSRSGMTVHVQGLTGTGKCNVSTETE